MSTASSLLSDEQHDTYVADVRDEYALLRAKRAGRNTSRPLASLAQARANAAPLDWSTYVPPAPGFTGQHVLRAHPLSDIVPRIDWTPFFQTWELAGRYPAILEDELVGASARDLFADAQALLDRIVRDELLEARAVFGFHPANRDGDDIIVWNNAARVGELERLHFLRQQMDKDNGRPNSCLADFIAPVETGLEDFIGMFAVTTGIGLEDLVAEFHANNDDYGAIMVTALADRLAEAFAERLHELVRTEFWGYAEDERLDNDALIRETYRGIRPAPGYPACPDHTEKRTLFRLMNVERRIGISLTESCAMTPASSVSGYYFAHPESAYFGVGRIGGDQVTDYAARRGMTSDEASAALHTLIDAG